MFVRGGHFLCDVPMLDVYIARETARREDRDQAITSMRAAVDHLAQSGQLLSWGIMTTGVLVETLLDRSDENDVAEAEAAIERLAAAPADEGLVGREIYLLRLRALHWRGLEGDVGAYTHSRDRYRDMARTLGLEAHTVWANAMPMGSLRSRCAAAHRGERRSVARQVGWRPWRAPCVCGDATRCVGRFCPSAAARDRTSAPLGGDGFVLALHGDMLEWSGRFSEEPREAFVTNTSPLLAHDCSRDVVFTTSPTAVKSLTVSLPPIFPTNASP